MKKITKLSTIIFILISLINLSSCGEHQHTFDEGRTIQEATCLAEGIKEYKCTKCDETRQETINKLEHIYETTIIKATCKEAGSEIKVCKLCNDTIEMELEKIDHRIIIDKAVEPSCTRTGLTEGSHCSECGEVTEKQETIEKLEHNYVNGKCSDCDTKQPNYVDENASKGLAFELNADAKSYSLIGVGTCTDTNIIVPSVYKGLPVTSIEEFAFVWCFFVESIEIKDSVTYIGGAAFGGCGNLKSVEIPSSVTKIGINLFEKCTSLTSINVDANNRCYKSINGNLYTKDGTKLIQYAIGKSDTSFVVPDSVTSIEHRAFSFCKSLTSIEIPNSVTNIVLSAFEDLENLTSISVDNNNQHYKSIDGNLYSKDEKTFLKYATGKKDIIFVIPNSVISIAESAFAASKSITTVIIPNSVTSIDDSAFAECISLTTVIIPDSVTSIGPHAFVNCIGLVKIELSKNVTTIGIWAFAGDTKLIIYCEAKEKPSGWHTDWNYRGGKVIWGYKK